MSRRGNSEGSIYRRKDGRWVGSMSLGYFGGKPKRKYFYGKTRQDVARKLAAGTRDRDRGLPVIDERQTVGQFLDQWLETSAKPSVRPRTYETYSSHVRVHLKPAFGRIPLAKLTPHHVQSFMNQKLEDGLAPATVLRIRATLRRALNQALRWGMVARNVATLVDAPKVERANVAVFTPEQVRQFLQVIRGDRLEALYVVALGIGLRQGEVLGLRWVDVDLEAGALAVHQTLQRIEGELQLVPPKTKKSQRALALPDIIVQRLRENRARQNRERLAAGDDWHDWGLVFTTTLGKPLIGSNVTRSFQRLLKRHGLPRMRFHDLRHSCASFMLAQDVSLKVVQETLGHSQISLTADTYTHVLPALQRDAADRMDAFLKGESEVG